MSPNFDIVTTIAGQLLALNLTHSDAEYLRTIIDTRVRVPETTKEVEVSL